MILTQQEIDYRRLREIQDEMVKTSGELDRLYIDRKTEESIKRILHLIEQRRLLDIEYAEVNRRLR